MYSKSRLFKTKMQKISHSILALLSINLTREPHHIARLATSRATLEHREVQELYPDNSFILLTLKLDSSWQLREGHEAKIGSSRWKNPLRAATFTGLHTENPSHFYGFNDHGYKISDIYGTAEYVRRGRTGFDWFLYPKTVV